jgi:NodT family efflux transporter outer membrane factor (OMF) lipoprotein
MRKSIEILAAFALTASTLAGCAAVTPKYVEPEPQAPVGFGARDSQLTKAPAEAGAWWAAFEDPVLDELIERASTANHDLRAAVARLAAARARYRQADLGHRPTGGLSAERNSGESSDFEQLGSIDSHRIGFDASWELDLFGRIESSIQAADARAGVAEATLVDLRITITAEVARTYFELRGAEARARLFEQYVADQEAIVELTASRLDNGASSEADLSRARAQLAADSAALLAEQDRAVRIEHALAVLIGQTPGQWRAPATPTLVALGMRPIAIGDPVSLLRRRPDVRVAERSLAAATADIGIATAALFPQVRISGFLGYAVGSASNLGEGGSGSWLATPAISWPLFDLSRIRADIRAREAEASAALAEYEQAVLAALRDAEDAFNGYATAQRRLTTLVEQAAQARLAAELAGVQYEEGEADYLSALDAARTARTAEASLLDGLVEQRLATVAVHKALGTPL